MNDLMFLQATSIRCPCGYIGSCTYTESSPLIDGHNSFMYRPRVLCVGCGETYELYVTSVVVKKERDE